MEWIIDGLEVLLLGYLTYRVHRPIQLTLPQRLERVSALSAQLQASGMKRGRALLAERLASHEAKRQAKAG